MPQQRIWKPVPWSPSVPKTKSAKQQRKAALNTNDVFSAESLAKHKVSIADVLLSEPQAPASPAKRERAPADSAAVAASQGDAETILADESAWPALKTKTAAPPEDAGAQRGGICYLAPPSGPTTSSARWSGLHHAVMKKLKQKAPRPKPMTTRGCPRSNRHCTKLLFTSSISDAAVGSRCRC